ncbi:hypothetical protein K491DRAFT_754027 [Lophiostoma macrostomum CBS 122681]|uniref:Nucleolar protein NOP52 variant n=1 Tax=Lophiostoma macrostomum CBS 122681 TaxID=1314788 RepID=A0A6A6TQF9_9PLEO|nr:hypothetical protein K491DRAFT_754027 [Lophiostoma macrostomum CBS 122681]
MATEPDLSSSPFIKHLASSDKPTRDLALSSLRTYLTHQPSIAPLDLLKLWKGLFYCLWMQDKPALQQRLARDLAALLAILQPGVVAPFLRAFWTTMAREWRNIEALRMDKYLFLVRQYVREGFSWAGKGGWGDAERVDGLVGVLGEGPLDAGDVKVPDGLRYHVLDVYVDELEKVGGREWEGKRDVLERLLVPVQMFEKEGRSKSVRKAAREVLEDERLAKWRGEAEVEDRASEDDEWGGIED